MKKTGGIIATILTSLFLGIPGIILGLIGMAALFVPSTQSKADQQLGSMVLLVGGIVLVLIPIIVGITTLRKKNKIQANVPFSPPEINPLPVSTNTIGVATPPPSLPQKQVPAPIPVPPFQDPSAEIRSRLLALNRPTAPWQIIDGASEGVDLIAEWKIVDAQWKDIFTKAKLSKTYRIYMKFDLSKKEVRTKDQENTVQVSGFPGLHAEASTFKGQQTSISFGTGYAFTETLPNGQIYKYRFNSNEMKKPIQDAIKAAGWTYKAVNFGKL